MRVMPIGRRCLAEGSKIMVRDQPNSAASLVKADRPALRLPVSLDIVRRDMSISRRHFLAALGSLSVAACDTAIPLVSVARTQAAPPDMRPVPNAAFSAWVTAFRSRASSAGISAQTLNTAFADAGYIPGVINRDRNQIQKRRTLEEYLSITVSDERLAKGRAAFSRHGRTLRAIEAKYGVDALIVTAIWGIESQYGEKRGTIPVISSTATLAFDGRRGSFYESQLLAALRILQRGDTSARQLVGSWAGAMGHTQFIPTSYQSFAVDFTGDGRSEIAMVVTPHLAGKLVVLAFDGANLTPVATTNGLTNHRIGDRDIAGGIRTCQGSPQMILAEMPWRAGGDAKMIAVGLSKGALTRAPFQEPFTPRNVAQALNCAINPG